MHKQNIRSLESLSWMCHLSGVILVFVGIVIIFFNLMNKNYLVVQYGIYIFASGYTQTLISKKLERILYAEQAE
ncbi:MAG: hypothetical protein ACLFPX_07400 [Candidatus Omnitrophota bacterium]